MINWLIFIKPVECMARTLSGIMQLLRFRNVCDEGLCDFVVNNSKRVDGKYYKLN